jgi:putative NADH-flavin reductase
VARCLIVACGCRGLTLTTELRSRGHAVRATTRSLHRVAELEAAGAEPHVGDPDRVATLFPALAHVGVACLLLGSVTGDPQALTSLFSTRLDMLMEKTVDTTVRGVVYETVGAVGSELLGAGAERVQWWCQRSLIPYVSLDADPAERTAWPTVAADAVERALLGG